MYLIMAKARVSELLEMKDFNKPSALLQYEYNTSLEFETGAATFLSP